jgi:probable rRNA maturation factor
MIHIKTDSTETQSIAPALLKKAALAALEHQRVPKPFDMTVLLAGDSHLQELNREYLGIDAPTDVLSFPSGELDPETGKKYLGDIIISVPRATQQAEAAGHTPEAETQLLVVHGVLHLLGHDHARVEDKTRMWQAQGEILESLGLGQIQVREE